MNPLRSIITRILPKAWFSPYEAANHSPRRGRVPGAAPRDAKLDLLPGNVRVTFASPAAAGIHAPS